MSVVKNENGRPILLAMVKAIQENKQYLGDVDGLIGDGDHGMNMNKGFTMYGEQLGDGETSFSDGLFDLGTVLLNEGLVKGDLGQYGLYISEVDGEVADYSVDKGYWALFEGDEYAMQGADTTPIHDGDRFRLAYTIG